MSKIPHKSKILQYSPANNQVADRESDKQASVGRIPNGSNKRPCIIPYHPQLTKLLGNVYAAIFLQQVYHRYKSNGHKPFYKFLAPCSSEYYRKGDSWIEELSFTYTQLKRAIGTVATRISPTKQESDVDKNLILSFDKVEMDATGKVLNSNALVLYWINRDHIMWWRLNLPLFMSLLQVANLSNPQNADQLIVDSSISLIGNPAIRFPHAETSNIDKSIAEPQSQFSILEKPPLSTAINPAQEENTLNRYVRVIEKACSVAFNSCSSQMVEEILSAARSLQAANRSL